MYIVAECARSTVRSAINVGNERFSFFIMKPKASTKKRNCLMNGRRAENESLPRLSFLRCNQIYIEWKI